MKSLMATLLVMLVAILLIVYTLSFVARSSGTTETEHSTSASSYEQKTNHFPREPYDLGPIQGSESPYKVNQWLSYQV
jgi:hypothetical protein